MKAMNEESEHKTSSPGRAQTLQTDFNIAPGDGKSENRNMTNSRTSPKQSEKSGWKMPEPVFRVSDGYCPLEPNKSKTNYSSQQARGENNGQETPDAAHAGEEKLPDITLFNINPSELKASIAESAETEPIVRKQSSDPERISTKNDVSTSEDTSKNPENKLKSKTAFIFFAVLGVFIMFVLTASVLAIAYFWFFYRNAGEPQF